MFVLLGQKYFVDYFLTKDMVYAIVNLKAYEVFLTFVMII